MAVDELLNVGISEFVRVGTVDIHTSPPQARLRTARHGRGTGPRPRRIAGSFPAYGYFLPLPLACDKSLAATLFCALVDFGFVNCFDAALASFLLVAISFSLSAGRSVPALGRPQRTPLRS